MIKVRMSDKQSAFEMSSKHSAYFVSLGKFLTQIFSECSRMGLGKELNSGLVD